MIGSRWFGDSSLRDSIPTLFAIVTLKDAWVANLCQQEGPKGSLK